MASSVNSSTARSPDQIQVVHLSANAKTPVRCSELAAGFDLYSAQDVTVPARGHAIIPTDLQIAVPPGTYGRIASRSGLAAIFGVTVGGGVIDADYRGNVRVILFNHTDQDYLACKGDRIAQLICERILATDITLCQTLDNTARGEAGFGSTGTN